MTVGHHYGHDRDSGGVAAGNVRPTLWLAVIIGVSILGREILKTIADYEGI